MPKRFIDVSHEIRHGMITYKGLPGPVISVFRSREESRQFYSPGTDFHIGKIDMVANTGTYIDAPFHRFPDGKDLSELSLPSLANLEGIVVRANQSRTVDLEQFEGRELQDKAVLVHTGWDQHWGTEQYFEGNPFLTRRAVQYLVNAKVSLVGIDSLNIDDTTDGTRPAHTLLLAAGIPLVEHLCNLGALPDNGFRFFAVPAKVRGLGSFPVRAFAILDE